ncbi:MAG: hypothetical protein IT186_27085, partial [Acidobacteria bacterium]|nr:hypothetical protein [Acidobacteriota bacterium]
VEGVDGADRGVSLYHYAIGYDAWIDSKGRRLRFAERVVADITVEPAG